MKKILLFALMLTVFGAGANAAWCPDNTKSIIEAFRIQIQKHENDIKANKLPFEINLEGEALKVIKLDREYTHHPDQNLATVLTYPIIFNTGSQGSSCEAQFTSQSGKLPGINMLSISFEKH
ncbi:MAG: hypothetical protein BGO67_06310 [Alphaproteobacteria bacterium 41-28]|nr:MAG: hypothetical protein BGO67_06310 [Alphaproteobacteria bacterium 41-28]